jgi:uncharacterized membrane protein YoaK (UPF0700 family)
MKISRRASGIFMLVCGIFALVVVGGFQIADGNYRNAVWLAIFLFLGMGLLWVMGSYWAEEEGHSWLETAMLIIFLSMGFWLIFTGFAIGDGSMTPWIPSKTFWVIPFCIACGVIFKVARDKRLKSDPPARNIQG